MEAEKATITITVKDKKITAGDSLPSLASPVSGTDYTISGLKTGDTLGGSLFLSYQKDGVQVAPDVSKAGTYDIVASGADIPDTGAYEEEILYTKGTLTIEEGDPVSSPGASPSASPSSSLSGTPSASPSSSPSAPPSSSPSASPSASPGVSPSTSPDSEAEENSGSQETTETNADGTKTTTTVHADGSVTKVVMDVDGNILSTTEIVQTMDEETGEKITTETTEYADGSREVTVTKENADGSKEVTVTKENVDGSKEETVTKENVDGSKEETVKKENVDGSNEEIITRESTDGSKEVSSEKTNADGSKEIVSQKENPDGTEKGSSVSIGQSGTVQEIVIYEKTLSGETTVPYQLRTESTVKVEKITTTEKNLAIPKTITPADGKTYKVTAIGNNALKSNKLVQKVAIGNNIRTIGKSAFGNCTNLKKVKFSNQLTELANEAFKGCRKLTGVSLPSTTKKIGTACFKNCKKMTKFTLGTRNGGGMRQNMEGNTAYGSVVQITIAAKALENCSNLKEVVINSQVRKIGDAAFRQCKKLARIIIYSLVLKRVGKKALTGVHNCKIKVPKVKIKPYKVLFTNKGQGKKVVVAKM